MLVGGTACTADALSSLPGVASVLMGGATDVGAATPSGVQMGWTTMCEGIGGGGGKIATLAPNAADSPPDAAPLGLRSEAFGFAMADGGWGGAGGGGGGCTPALAGSAPVTAGDGNITGALLGTFCPWAAEESVNCGGGGGRGGGGRGGVGEAPHASSQAGSGQHCNVAMRRPARLRNPKCDLGGSGGSATRSTTCGFFSSSEPSEDADDDSETGSNPWLTRSSPPYLPRNLVFKKASLPAKSLATRGASQHFSGFRRI